MKNVCAGFFSLTNKQLVRLFESLDSVGIQGACGFSFVICIYLLKREKRKFNLQEETLMSFYPVQVILSQNVLIKRICVMAENKRNAHRGSIIAMATCKLDIEFNT